MRKFLVLLIIFVFIIRSGISRDIYFQQLGSIHGLSQSSAISIWQDYLGRMWIGNDALNCYDGETVKVYRLSEYFSEIEDANIHTITGNSSVLFTIAENDLVYMDIQKETFHLTGIKTQSVCCTNDRAYYFADGNFNSYNWENEQIDTILTLPESVKIVRDILAIDNNTFWLATPVGIFVVDIETRSIAKRMLEEEDITRLYKDSHQYVWMICRSRQIYTTRTGAYIPQPLTIKSRHGNTIPADIFCIQEDAKGSIWLGTLSGLYQLTKETLTDIGTISIVNHVIPEANIFALHIDKQGSLWVGSYYGDVRYFNPEVDNYVYYPTDENHPERLHGAVIGPIVEDERKNLYIATEGSGINILSTVNQKFAHIKQVQGLRQNKIRDIWYDKQYKRLYISEYMDGLSYYDIQNSRIYPIKNDTLKNVYQRIIEEILPYGNYLILRTQDGLFKLDRNTLKITHLFADPYLQEMCSSITRTIYIDSHNILWLSSFERGLFTIDMETGKILRNYGDGLKDKSNIPSAIVDICEDEKKGIFLATLNSGVLAYNPQKDEFIRYTEKQNELLSDICYNICFSWHNNLIVTSNKGISILNLASREQLNSVHHIPLSSSFPLVALSGDCGLYSSAYSDNIYVGGIYGLLSFSEKDLVVNKSSYSLYFSSISINSNLISPPSEILPKPVHCIKEINLSHNQNTIGLSFASSNYLSTQNTVYEYKMEGIETYWNVTSHKKITYNSLPPGNYKLTVREIHSPHKFLDLKIKINAPFWKTLPAIILYVLMVLSITFLILRFLKSRALLRASLELKKREMVHMEEVNKNKMDFFINISNEFRTPLTLILSQLDHMTYEMPANSKKKLDKIKTQTLRLQDLITELLDFRKMEENKLSIHVENTDLNQFIKKIYLTYIDYASDKQIIYRYSHTNEPVQAWFDQKQLQKVIYNMLTFVFKYASKKDSIIVSLLRRSKWIEVCIRYNGNLPERQSCDYLFALINGDAIQSLDPSLLPEGGLGLVFSKGIAKLHRGDISVKYEENYCVFTLNLQPGNTHFSETEIQSSTYEPEHLQEAIINIPETTSEETGEELIVQEGYLEENKPTNNDTRYTMLLIEDDYEIRVLLKEIFSFNYKVIEMSDTAPAYEYIIREKPDIVICEITVSNHINGIELCSMLKNNIQTLHIPIILLSSHPSEKQQIESIRAGADDYIIKPFNIEVLILRCNYLVKYRKKILQHQPEAPTINTSEIATNTRDRDFLVLAQQIIEKNFSNPDFDTSVWSKELGIGRTRLFSQIKAITGMTPNDYILNMKLNKSLILLSNHTLTIGEIAYQLGFSSPAYFSKCFKKQFGVTPAEYRKKIQ